jgi:hypothetical protein
LYSGAVARLAAMRYSEPAVTVAARRCKVVGPALGALSLECRAVSSAALTVLSSRWSSPGRTPAKSRCWSAPFGAARPTLPRSRRRDWRPDPIHINKKELLCIQPRAFYDTAGADRVPACILVHCRCPVGALIDYAGTPKSPYHSPTMGRVTESKEHYRPWSRS